MNGDFIITCFLSERSLKNDLKKWNVEVFRNVDSQKNSLMEGSCMTWKVERRMGFFS